MLGTVLLLATSVEFIFVFVRRVGTLVKQMPVLKAIIHKKKMKTVLCSTFSVPTIPRCLSLY